MRSQFEFVKSALSLFEFSEKNSMPKNIQESFDRERSKLFTDWMMIASRETVMGIYHFAKAKEAFKVSLKAIENIEVDWKEIRSATKKFNRYFPDFENMRHAVAHSAELTKDRQQYDKNSFSGDYDNGLISATGVEGLVLSGGLMNRSYTMTFQGKIITLEITKTTLQNLYEIYNDFSHVARKAGFFTF